MKQAHHRILKLSLLGLAMMIAGCGKQAPAPYDNPDLTIQELRNHVKYLASDELKGRRTGTPGANGAAEYLVDQFKSHKVIPGNHGDYYQRFDFIGGVELGENNSLTLYTGEGDRHLTLNQDFKPLGFSNSGTATGDLVFAGYGITADSLNYDDYANIDAKNKVVVLLRYGPEGDNPHGEFSQYLALRYKASNAKSHGAAGIIVIPGPEPYPEDELIKLQYDQSADAGIPAVSAKRAPFEPLFVAARDSLAEIQADMNLHKTGMGFQIPHVKIRLQTDVNYVHKIGRNVVGYIPGADPELQDQYLVIGAHYDHLGMGGEGSLAPGTVAIHNGADDNASGTAGVLELAEYFAADDHRPNHSLVFVAFSGEENGLLGSAKYVDDPPLPLQSTKAMINMDMIGRPSDSTLVVGGVGTSPVWDSLLTGVNNHFQWNLTKNESGYGPSDHGSFYLKDLPVLFFFTGVHEDYHRPTDDWQTLDYGQYHRVLSYIAGVIDSLDRHIEPIPFTKAGSADSRRMAFRVSLQIIPDYASNVHGLRITGVKDGGPAEKAGLQDDDIIVQFGHKEINNIYDYTYALQEFEPGAVVDIIAKRNGTAKRFTVELERRE